LKRKEAITNSKQMRFQGQQESLYINVFSIQMSLEDRKLEECLLP